MKICFVINGIDSEKCGTTVYIMTEAQKRGHEVLITTVEGFNFSSSSKIDMDCSYLPKNSKPEDPKEFFEILQGGKLKQKRIAAKDLDVLFIRNNPTEEADGRNWAEHAGIAFGRMIQQEGVLVLNDAFGLSKAYIDKLYFEELPEEIKPASLITRNKKDILEFYEKHKNKVILKPLEGSGGQDVYLIDKDGKNLNQIITNLLQDGYVIAQEFLPDVKEGDVRVLLLNGRIMQSEGNYSLFRRVNSKDEFRSNLSLGAKAKATKYTDEMKHIVELIAPKIIKDGLFFVGLDIVKDKLIEINVLSPGGIDAVEIVGNLNCSPIIIDAIENKLKYKKLYGNNISNTVLATME